jgi:hypothetical protein
VASEKATHIREVFNTPFVAMGPKKVMKATKAKKSALQYKWRHWADEEADPLGEELSNDEDEVMEQMLHGPSAVIAIPRSTASSSAPASSTAPASEVAAAQAAYSSRPSMRIYANLNGCVIELQVWPQDMISSVIGQIQAVLHVPADRIALWWQGVEMSNDLTLEDYGIQQGAVLVLKRGP